MKLSSARSSLLLMIGTALLSVVGLGLVGCGGSGSPTTSESAASLGKPPQKDVPTVPVRALSEEAIGQTVRVEGKVVQQCPAVGCWLLLQDETGKIFVDLGSAQLNLTSNRVGQHARATGRVGKEGGRLQLEAQYVEFTAGERAAPANEKSDEK